MTSDISQTNFREAEQADWDNWNTGSKYQAPPPALDPGGDPIVYYGIVEKVAEKFNQYEVDSEGNPFLNFALDPIKLVRAGSYDGYVIRFTEASVRPFTKVVNGERVNIKGNPNKLGNYLRATGLTAKPQTNDQYKAAVKQAQPRTFGFTIDWVAKSKDGTEKITGYKNFPDDPDRPGQKKAILKAGDHYQTTDRDGFTQTHTVQSEVIFANARVRFFVDPTRRNGGA